MTTTHNTWSERIAGRKEAETLLELAHGALAGKSEAFATGFRARMTLEYAPPKTLRKAAEPMPDEECRRFEQATWPFGKHKDKPIEEVPLTYLDWFIGTEDQRKPNKLKLDAARYLANPTIGRLLEEQREQDARDRAGVER